MFASRLLEQTLLVHKIWEIVLNLEHTEVGWGKSTKNQSWVNNEMPGSVAEYVQPMSFANGENSIIWKERRISKGNRHNFALWSSKMPVQLWKSLLNRVS